MFDFHQPYSIGIVVFTNLILQSLIFQRATPTERVTFTLCIKQNLFNKLLLSKAIFFKIFLKLIQDNVDFCVEERVFLIIFDNSLKGLGLDFCSKISKQALTLYLKLDLLRAPGFRASCPCFAL